MPNDPKTDALGLPSDESELRAAAAVMQERLRIIEKADAEKAAAEKAALDLVPEPDPLVEVEWLKTPQRGGCYHVNRYYTGRGPKIHKATGRILEAGEKATLPADAARCFAEAGYVRILSGLEHIRWSPVDGAPPVSTAHPDPGDSTAWEALAS